MLFMLAASLGLAWRGVARCGHVRPCGARAVRVRACAMAWLAVLGVLWRWAPRRWAVPRLVDRRDAAAAPAVGLTAGTSAGSLPALSLIINTFHSNKETYLRVHLFHDEGR